MSIRLFPKVRWTFDALRDHRTFTEKQGMQLCRAVQASDNILVAGAMGSGKTSSRRCPARSACLGSKNAAKHSRARTCRCCWLWQCRQY